MCFTFLRKLLCNDPWYLAGGIPAGACVAAYRAKGASSLAGSYTNLANPGVYTCTAPVAAPTWAVDSGWIFNGTTQYLQTTLYPTEEMSAIVKFDNATTPANNYPTLFGPSEGGKCFYIHPRSLPGYHYYVHGSNGPAKPLQVNGLLTSGIMAMAKYTSYLNGVIETGTGTPSGWVGVSTVPIPIGRRSDGYNFAGNMQAIAFYSIEITQSMVVAITAAMNAL